MNCLKTMSQPSLQYVHCPDATGGHRMAYWQWGNAAAAHVVVCVHGLSRQGRDFDTLAAHLVNESKGDIRVVCPDVVGRGESDWLKDPTAYQVPTYAADMLVLLGQLHVHAPITKLDWVGTSMGGLIGLIVCGQPGLPLPAPVNKLVLNDVGPAIEWQSIVRIGTYLGAPVTFDSLQEGANLMWTISSGFGPHTPEQWLALSTPMLRSMSAASGSRLRLHYDPALAVPFRQATEESMLNGEKMLWQLYDNITAHTLLLRGAQSDLLSPATAQAMGRRGPKAKLVEFAGVGHAPTLMAANQLTAVTGFLLN